MKGTGSFNIKINESAKPYFFDLKNNFTALQLKSVLNCSSKYAKDYMLLLDNGGALEQSVLKIQELKQMLGLIDKKGNEQF
ncbi:replication initiation protein [Chryseobacterium mulctrae]|uniref:replication initiation protein n=1 Tax=Chryseobacterium mulctrae TaxID=2576777 RepID=UPI0021CFE118|nr:replication initiation protein [Chryseobacterium mulctrae]